MPYDKNSRQRAIQEIIQRQAVQTQEELALLLAEQGISATQATVSRDIKELGLIKIPHQEGHRYGLPGPADQPGASERLRRILHEAMVSVVVSDNLVVVKTVSGGANVVSEAIDRQEWDDVVGTIAGDNTVLVVAESREAAPAIADRLLSVG